MIKIKVAPGVFSTDGARILINAGGNAWTGMGIDFPDEFSAIAVADKLFEALECEGIQAARVS